MWNLIKLTVVVALIGSCLLLRGQTTRFSKFHDLQIGNGGYPLDVLIYGDSYFTVSLHLCQDSSYCTAVCRIDHEGNVADTLLIEGFYAGSDSPLVLVDSGFLVSCHQLDSLTISHFARVDIDLRDVNIVDVDNGLVQYVNNGVLNGVGGNIITYGSVYHPLEEKYGGYVTTWETDLSGVFNHIVFDLEEVGTGIFDLHLLDSESQVFTSFIHRPEQDDYYIHELHSDTLKLVYSYSDFVSANPTLLVDTQGNYYFGSYKHPEFTFPPSTGRLNKISSYTGDLAWSLKLPSTPSDFRSYYVQDIIETSEGNIVVCGTVEDSDELGSATTGFVASATNSGILSWLRVFKFPNYINPEALGFYRRSSLRKVKEDIEGNLIGFGYSYQFSSDGVPKMELWVLGLDKNGCLNPDSCEEISVITNQRHVQNDEDNLVVYPNPVYDNLYFNFDDEFQFTIWDANMTLVKTGLAKESIMLRELPPALYILRIDDSKSRETKIMKIIKL